jgi:hypothetical protein
MWIRCIRIRNTGLQFHHRVPDVAERHPTVGKVVQDAAQAPHVRLEADFHAGLRLSRGIYTFKMLTKRICFLNFFPYHLLWVHFHLSSVKKHYEEVTKL